MTTPAQAPITLRQDIAALYREVGARGLIVGSSGNVSARTERGMLITPTGAQADTVTPDSLVELALDGTYDGPIRPSSEWQMHAEIYRAAPHAMAIVHTHSDNATALACLNLPLPAFHYDVAGFGGDDVPVAPYATFATPELAHLAAAAIAGRTACLLANHGMICHGRTPQAALLTAIRLEAMCRQYLIARAAGTPRLLTSAEMESARQRYRGYGQQPDATKPKDFMMTAIDQVLARIDADLPEAQRRWMDWLRIPSISAQPAHAPDCRKAAEYIRTQLAELGFTATLRETAGQPVVVAHHPGPDISKAGGNLPHLLYYGHYDVQPADPVELWTAPPFEPAVVDGPHGKRVVARGAVDDKGQVAMWLGAFRAWHGVTGTMPCRLTVLIEGEEEVGSLNFKPFVTANRDELKADFVVISDTGMWDIDTPAITTALRGLLYTEVKLKAASRDLHSGLYGGSALNPINALTQALGQLRDSKGRVQIPGFYDGVPELPPALAAQWESLHFDEKRFLGDIGLSVPSGESGRGALERLWARPTADICGIWGGYSGPGAKTVIPAEAGAKVSFRLVGKQNPDKILENFRRFLQDRIPADAKLEVSIFSAGPGTEIATDSKFVRAGIQALTQEYGRAPVLAGCGGSIPVVETLLKELGIGTLMFGFSLDDDQVHSPNEKFELRCFHQGMRSHARLLGLLTD